MRKAALLQFDLFVTTISDAAGLQCFIYPQSLFLRRYAIMIIDFSFLTEITDELERVRAIEALTEFVPLLPVSKWPEVIERMLPDYLQGKIIIEINNGQQILFKICEYCFEQLSETTGFVCVPCYENNSKTYK